jgi:hypothetical protein
MPKGIKFARSMKPDREGKGRVTDPSYSLRPEKKMTDEGKAKMRRTKLKNAAERMLFQKRSQ